MHKNIIKLLLLMLFLLAGILTYGANEENSYFNEYGYPTVFDGYLESYNDDFKIDADSYKAISEDQRIKYIILHYTATDDDLGKRALTYGDVSSHYLVTTLTDDPIYSLVPNNERAWHAGVSNFYGRTNINDSSIGIEIVNKGMSNNNFIPYTNEQIKKVGYLVKNLAEQYKIDPKFVLGHSDIAPGRKLDPGPKFPWEYLYREYGIGAWYDKDDLDAYLSFYTEEKFKSVPVLEVKGELYKYGYNINSIPQYDNEAKNVISAFQSHFNQNNVTGIMDRNTFAILKALNKKYRTQKLPPDFTVINNDKATTEKK